MLEIIPESSNFSTKATIALSATYETVTYVVLRMFASEIEMRFRDISSTVATTVSMTIVPKHRRFNSASGERTADVFIPLLSAYPLPVKIYE